MEKTATAPTVAGRRLHLLPVRAPDAVSCGYADWMDANEGTILLTAHEYESRKAPAGNSITHTARREHSVILPPTCLQTSPDPHARATIDKGGNYCLPSGYCFLNNSSHGNPRRLASVSALKRAGSSLPTQCAEGCARSDRRLLRASLA
jgi:hypothetical protein